MFNLFIISLIPLVLFAIINYYTDLRTSVISSIVSAGVMIALLWFWLEWFDYELMIMIILLSVFGAIAIWKNDEFYFKLQPAISGMGLAAVMLYFEIIGDPLITKFLPKMSKLLPPEHLNLLKNPQVITTLHTVSLHAIFWIALHGALLAWTAKNSSTKIWLLVKAGFLPVFMLIMFITMLIINRP